MKLYFPVILFFILTSCVTDFFKIKFSDSVKIVDSDFFLENICSLDSTTNDFNVNVRSNKPFVIFFYDDYVSNCQKESYVFNEIAKANSSNINFFAINASENIVLLKKLGVKNNPKLPFLGFFGLNRKYQIEYLNGNILDINQMDSLLSQFYD